jgi:hypothetical protein
MPLFLEKSHFPLYAWQWTQECVALAHRSVWPWPTNGLIWWQVTRLFDKAEKELRARTEQPGPGRLTQDRCKVTNVPILLSDAQVCWDPSPHN